MFDTPLKVIASIFISIFALMPVAIVLLISLSQIISIAIISVIPVSIFYLIFRKKKPKMTDTQRNLKISELYRIENIHPDIFKQSESEKRILKKLYAKSN